MPIYEYECAKCRERFEKMRKVNEQEAPECPSCGSAKKVKRIISPAGFVLKGSGWYKTDYPSEARKKGVAAEKGGGAPKSDTGEKKPDEKKPEKKADKGEKKK